MLLPVPDVAAAGRLHEQLQARFTSDHTALELFEIIRGTTLQRALVHAEQTLRDGVTEAPYYVLALLTSDRATAASAFGSIRAKKA